jgi:hypothetical protein
MVVSCTEDNSTGTSKDELVNTVSNGTWRITYFFDSDTDETTNFSGYSFTFGASDLLTATNVTNTYTGSWNISDSSSDDDSPDDLDFNIIFTNPDNFEELSEDWEVLSSTSVKIELRHVSGGDGSTDYLTFEKN